MFECQVISLFSRIEFCSLLLRDLSLKTLEGFWDKVLNESIELSSSVFLFAFLSGKSDSDSSVQVSDTVGPEGLVKLGVDSDILSGHVFLGESLDLVNSSGGLILELDSVDSLVQVDGDVSGGLSQLVLLSLGSLGAIFSHLNCNNIILTLNKKIKK